MSVIDLTPIDEESEAPTNVRDSSIVGVESKLKE